MLENIAGKVLDRFLSKYFEDETEHEQPPPPSAAPAGRNNRKRKNPTSRRTNFQSGIWAGFLSLDDLRLRVQVINEQLQAAGLPIELVHCSIRKAEMTVPWGQWKILSSSSNNRSSPGSAAAVLVLDGVHVLARVRFDNDDSINNSQRERAINRRRQRLMDATADLTSSSAAAAAADNEDSNPTAKANVRKSWKELLKVRLQEGILPAVLDRLQLHIRDLHIRIEDCQPRKDHDYDPFAIGILLQSIHVQHNLEAAEDLDRSERSNQSQSSTTASPSLIHKVAELNRLGLYCNPLEHEGDSFLPASRVEQKILQNLSPAEIIRALDKTIPRRSVESAEAQIQQTIPQHVYLLQPLDGRLHAAISTTPKSLSDHPAVRAICTVTDVSFQIRDFQCLQLMHLFYGVKEFKYSLRHRHLRPVTTVREDPRAWWFYAVAAIRIELTEKHHRLRWSFGRFRRQLYERKRYCDLYERKLRERSPDDAAGPRPSVIITVPGPSTLLTPAERMELEEMEDGVLGDLSIQDILLYRIIVHKRIGLKPSVEEPTTASGGGRASWFKRRFQSMVGEEVEEDEYLRLLEYWRDWSSVREERNGNEDLGESISSTAAAFELRVERGQLLLFSPLSSTTDQPQLHRLQERFMDFTYTGFGVDLSLMGDYDSLAAHVSLEDFTAAENRSNHKRYAVIAREDITKTADESEKADPKNSDPPIEPLCFIRFTKKSPEYQDFRFGVQCRLRKVSVDFVPDCEWIGRFKLLIKPIPQFQRAQKFWRELSMAYINSWASSRLGLLAKAETAVSDHSGFDLDVELECPIFRVEMSPSSTLSVDLGRADLKTEKLAGVASSHLLRRTVEKRSLVRKASSIVGEDSVGSGARDDASWRTPRLAKKPGINASGEPSTNDTRLNTVSSVDFGASLRIDDSVLDLGENYVSFARIADKTKSDQAETYFYDTYELRIRTGDMRIGGNDKSNEKLASTIEFHAVLHKSIIPADHTLCRYKITSVIDDISIFFSKSQILQLVAAGARWTSVLSSLNPAPSVARNDFFQQSDESGLISPLSPEINDESQNDRHDDESQDESDFDEAEFFDAAEDETCLSDHVSVLLDDDWVADSESVLESESRSKSPSIRRRPRQSSVVSEVSSISEGSMGRRRLQFQDTEEQLFPENLGRLEEEESDERSESQAESFHSAVSLSKLATIAHDLEKDIAVTNARIDGLKASIKDLRHSQVLDGDSQRKKSKKQFRIELERATVELRALKAAYVDISSQLNDSGVTNGSGDIGYFDRNEASDSLRNATSLIQSIKKKSRGGGLVDNEHSMTKGLIRELFQCSMVVQKVEIQLSELDQGSRDAHHCSPGYVHDTCTVRVLNAAGIIRHRVGEKKLFASIDTVALNIFPSETDDEQNECIFVGGIQDFTSRHLFTARFPEYAFSSGLEEKFVKLTLDFRQSAPVATDAGNAFKIARLRFKFGEIEITPRLSSLLSLYKTMSSIRGRLAGGFSPSLRTNRVPEPNARSLFDSASYYDAVVRCAAVRVILEKVGNFGAAVLLSEVGARAVGCSVNQLFKDKARLDLRCSNAQAVYLLEAQEAVQVFGKRDAYGPSLVRLRMKLQAVPVDCPGGWVLDRPDVSDSEKIPVASFGAKREASPGACVRNCHVGAKVESIYTLVIPSAISGFLAGLQSLKEMMRDFQGKAMASVVRSDHQDTIATVGAGIPVRWRADLSLRDLCVAFDGEANGLDKFELTMSLVATAQISTRLRKGIVLNGSVRNLALSWSADQLMVLKPSSIGICVEAATKGSLCNDLEVAQLALPADFPWMNWEEESRSGHPTRVAEVETQIDLVVTIMISELVIDVSALMCVSATRLITLFQDALPKKKESNKRLAVSKPSGDKGKNISIVLDGLSLNLFRGQRTETSIVLGGPLCSFLLQNVSVDCQRGELTSSILLKAFHCSLVDYASKLGIRGLGIMCGDSQEDVTASIILSFETVNTTGRSQAKLALDVGRINVLLLPTLIRSLFNFFSDFRDIKTANATAHLSFKIEESNPNELSTKLSTFASLSFSVQVESLEVILSSKDIPKFIKDNKSEVIGVVTCRLKLEASGLFRIFIVDGELATIPDFKLDGVGPAHEGQEPSSDFLHARPSCEQLRSAVLSQLCCTVKNFQLVRTALAKAYEQRPFSFFVSPPSEGEQRITNDFGFAVTQKAALVLSHTACSSDREPGVCLCHSFSHSLQLEADYVDVLVYISQSAGGMSEAIRVTIVPILDVFKHRTSTKRANSGKGFKESVLESSSTLSVKASGVNVTFVPGGATRLTESPIIKFDVLRLALGCAAVPVKSEVKLLSETSLDTMSSKLAHHHLISGVWVGCELSASYHNRRLVTWEPFIEPWTLQARFGADLVRLGILSPISTRTNFQDNSHLSKPSITSSIEAGSKRLRDIGRLLRSPFNPRNKVEKEASFEETGEFETQLDLCYLLLLSSARDLLSAALFPQPSSLKGNAAVSVLPGSTPLQWLHDFGGFPLLKGVNSDGLSKVPALVCWLSDAEVPLNVNMSGALIENLSAHASTFKEQKTNRLVPHWIRNESGLTIRFQEVLDSERLDRNERARKFILSNGSEVPLSLKRTQSQSCDPHRAHIVLELGDFEETVGRMDRDLKTSRGSRSTDFSYKITAKVPVDTVGVHRYPLDWNRRQEYQTTARESRSLGWIIVRVALSDGIKLVSIESPLTLKNTSDVDLLCEVRDHGGLSVLWRCTVAKEKGENRNGFISVPADIVPSLHGRSRTFGAVALANGCEVEHEVDAPYTGLDVTTHINLPPPSSSSSVGKGIIEEKNINLRVLGPLSKRSVPLNICSLRIGSSDELISAIPEQRMLVFRSALTVQNHLALPIQVQVRIKGELPQFGEQQKNADLISWTDLGVLQCAAICRWAGARPTDTAEIRVRVTGHGGESSRQFPSWSSPVTIPCERVDGRTRVQSRTGELKIFDSSNVPLQISIAIWKGQLPTEKVSSQENIHDYSTKLPVSSRTICLFCPFWIVDGSGLDLQYKSKSYVAGQAEATSGSAGDHDTANCDTASSLGLGELLDDRDFIYLPSRISFQVLMIGEEGSSHLFARRRLTREATSPDSVSSWSDPISLAFDDMAYCDISVPPPPKVLSPGTKILGTSDVEESFALRARLVRAPAALGGIHGTKLIHVVCRYAVVNEVGQDIEILDSVGRFSPTVVPADGRPRPFHFDDSGPLRFRPKEYGWIWSGKFRVKRDQRELTLSLRHGLKGHRAIFDIEFHSKSPAGTCVIFFRPATHAPYRIENHTMFPIQYCQLPGLGERLFSRKDETSLQDHVILPYHHAEFAWDEPEYGRRTIKLNLADFGELKPDLDRSLLGSFKIDNVAPGAELEFLCSDLVGRVIAEGPTRVIRIIERSSPGTMQEISNTQFQQKLDDSSVEMTVIFSARFAHGLGLSIVDWQPQELFYIRLNGISLVQKRTDRQDTVNLSIGSITVDNQLWVTPYPVLLRMGTSASRRRNKRHNALSLSWCRLLNVRRGFGDFTFLENASSASLPSTICVDGNLVEHAIEMARRIKEIGARRDSAVGISRNQHLRNSLNLEDKVDNVPQQSFKPKSKIADDLYSAVDHMSTSAIAAKLRSRYRPPDVAGSTKRQDTSSKQAMFGLLTQRKGKIYIERLRISTIVAEISWSGSLPVASSLPRFLRPALTFEGLPLLLRPYSSAHAFGTAEEHLKAVKAHFFSVWRILDLVVGVMAKPSFIVRACIFTWRESCATAFISTSNALATTKKALESILQRADSDDGSRCFASLTRQALAPAMRAQCSFLGGAAGVLAAGSAFLRYNASRHRASGGLVRSRNPRLFANIDGNDLLVEYVEGENAGKALLSRVRRGAHLGEGYLYHIEGVHGLKTNPQTDNDMDKSPLILMLTFERLLLLHGVLDTTFCDVVWEASVEDLVRVEHTHLPQYTFDEVLLWYLNENGGSSSREERLVKSLITESGGLETLHCKRIFVPASLVKSFMLKIERLDHGRLC